MAEISVSYTTGNPKRPTTALTIVRPQQIDTVEPLSVALTAINTNPPTIDRQGVVTSGGTGTGSQTYWVTG